MQAAVDSACAGLLFGGAAQAQVAPSAPNLSSAPSASNASNASNASSAPAASSAAAPAAVGGSASGPDAVPTGIALRTAPSLQAPPRGDAGRALPIIVRARKVEGRPDLDAVAEGDVDFRRGGLVLRADRVSYDQAEDLARATGHVVVSRDGNVFKGPELELRVARFEGFFREPTYFFGKTGAGGTASRIDFVDEARAVATDATYSSCTSEAGEEPVWVLRASRLRLDNEANEGIARDAVLRFYGVPILASPYASFPLSDARKSGWLPPTVGLDSRSGFQASIPYYWNIAPNRDATLTASTSTRRGPALESEFRYAESDFLGEASYKITPHDELTGRSRYALRIAHEGALPYGAFAQVKVLRVSDDDYWKDFPRQELRTSTPRLLGTDLQLTRPFGDWSTYARIQRWQVLQTDDPTTRIFPPPYERLPQIGTRYGATWGGGVEVALEGEFNRFANPGSQPFGDTPAGVPSAPRAEGSRFHALGSIARPFASPGWTLTPKLQFNAASYALEKGGALADGRQSASRLIPTASLDSAWTFERSTDFFGRAVRQTLEPRLLYVNTPYRRQDDLPNFDAAAKDFNVDSIFTENAFSGVDRVSDAHQLTAGVTSRILDPDTGAEALRLGIVQRYLFREQRVTPDDEPLTRRFSDVIVFGSTSLVTNWNFDASTQYNPENSRFDRTLAGFRYSPGPFRTVGLNYRLTRGLSEQVELAWQWPLYGPARSSAERGSSSGRCSGTLYSVGRVNYSTRDSRVVDAIGGFEYDAGCWIGRVVAERLSTGRSEATTRLLLQIEFVGLSRLGSNPLRVLKENIPGYQLLRDDQQTVTPFTPYD